MCVDFRANRPDTGALGQKLGTTTGREPLRMRERVTSRYFETVVMADSTDRGKCSIKTSNRVVSFRKFILWTAR